MINYELHTFENGAWKIWATFEDKDDALLEARRLEEGIRRWETRVVEDRLNETTGLSKGQIIYTTPKLRDKKTDPSKQNSRPTRKVASSDSRPKAQIRPENSQPVATKAAPNMVMLELLFILIAILGIVGFIAARFSA
jgi:hypothetical protein